MIQDPHNNFIPDSWVTKTSFCIVSLVFKLLFHPDSVSSSVLSRFGFTFSVTEHQTPGYRRLNKRTVSPECTNYIGESGSMFPRKMFWKLDSRKRHILHSLDRTQLIHTCIWVGLFSESRYSWFPSRSTKIHDSQVFETKPWFFLIFCNYDSWFRFHPRH